MPLRQAALRRCHRGLEHAPPRLPVERQAPGRALQEGSRPGAARAAQPGPRRVPLRGRSLSQLRGGPKGARESEPAIDAGASPAPGNEEDNMASVNKVILIGNLGKDPEIRYTQAGDPIANFSLATNEVWTDKSGQKQERTEWHRVEVFGKPAQVVRDYLSKGRQVYVEGSIRYDEWTDKDGNKQKMTKIRVSGPNSRLVLLGGRGEGGPRAAQEPSGGPAGGEDFQASDDDVPF